MSQTSIGKAALILTTNGTGLRSGLDKAGADTRKWADDTGKAIDSRFKRVGDRVGGGLSSGLSTLGRFAGPAIVAAGSVKALGEAIETVNDLSKQGAAAKAFGLTAEQFTSISGLAKSVGGDTRELVESLVTLQKLGSDGALGKGEVATDFFKQLNLDAKQFNSLRLDEQFYKVFESIKALNTEGEQVRALMTAFGEDGGKNLLPLLSKSGAEIRQLAKGFAISSAEVAAATRAAEAFGRAQLAIEQLWRRIVVAAAPVLEFLANELNHTVNQFAAMDRTAVPALTRILRLTAQLADATKAVTAATLIATGARLKYASAEILIRGAATGGLKGLAQAALIVAALEATVGSELREAGGVLLKLGVKMLEDVGGSSRRVEGFITAFEKRKDGAPGKPFGKGGTVGVAAPPPPPVALKLTENAALLKGSAAEVSARLKNEFGTKSAAEKLLEETKKGTKHLGAIEAGVKALSDMPSGVVLAPF